MILMDWELGLLALSFLLFFGPVYAWGLLRWFRYNFRWSLAATTGIASVVSMTYVFVWQLRGIPLPIQAVWDLSIVFLSALPAMIYVDYGLKKTVNHKYHRLSALLEMYRAYFHDRQHIENNLPAPDLADRMRN